MSGGTRVFIGGVPHSARERDLERFCRGFGRIREVVLKNGYGFLEFEDTRDAEDAIHELNGRELLGHRVDMDFAHGPAHRYDGGYRNGGYRSSSYRSRAPPRQSRFGPPQRTDHRIIVENLSSRVSWQDLKDIMRQAGEVTYADAHKRHMNEGVVEFSSRRDMKYALDKLNDMEVKGRRIRLIDDSYDNREDSRSRSRSAGRNHSRRSRSYSRSLSVKSGRSSASRNGAASPRRSPSPQKEENEGDWANDI